jgi:hypothetical protein
VQTFYLTDGIGQQGFALIASAKPLPAYDQWRPKVLEQLWAISPSRPSSAVLRYDGKTQQVLVPRGQPAPNLIEKGTIGQRKPTTPFARLCEQLRRAAPADAFIDSVALPVMPQ